MQNENELPPEQVGEEIAQEESNDIELASIPKSELTKIRRKAFAYDALKEKESVKEAPTETKVPTTNALSEEVIEEKILLAEGIDEDLIKEMKVIAKLRGVSLLKAKKDPIVVAFMAEREREEKAKQASLGASRSSGKIVAKKTLNTPGLTPEEHKALWKEQFNK